MLFLTTLDILPGKTKEAVEFFRTKIDPPEDVKVYYLFEVFGKPDFVIIFDAPNEDVAIQFVSKFATLCTPVTSQVDLLRCEKSPESQLKMYLFFLTIKHENAAWFIKNLDLQIPEGPQIEFYARLIGTLGDCVLIIRSPEPRQITDLQGKLGAYFEQKVFLVKSVKHL